MDINKLQEDKQSNFIRDIIDADRASGKIKGPIVTRFPPEPNGYLHIGHAKSICLNFGIARDYKGRCHLRFDDTNPSKEEVEYIESIKADVRWLGFDWDNHLYFASDYFDALYQFAIELIKIGKAYVCDLTTDQMRLYRGTLTESGKNSPYRDRSIEENLKLFTLMKDGAFEEGSRTLRAKIDMSSPNITLRDPVMYRILKTAHHRTGSKWVIYPMYDYTHCMSDSFEEITHSICTLEFENNRPLYDWFLKTLSLPCHPQQIEFARLNLTYTLMSKRKLLQLVQMGVVDGWDDPRMPTISGYRRRGFSPEAIRSFADRIGVAKRDSTVDSALLDFCLREDLNKRAFRVFAVIKPIKVIIDNYPDEQVEYLDAVNNPEDPTAGLRKVPFSKVLYIEEDDFRQDPPSKYYRLSPGKEVRLRYAYYIKCESVVKDDVTGKIAEIHCSYDPLTRGGDSPDKRKVKGTIHWVSADHAIPVEVRLFDHLFTIQDLDSIEEGKNYLDYVNKNSLEIIARAYAEPYLMDAQVGVYYQFERLGYFGIDSKYSTAAKKVFNRSVTLRDSWAKFEKSGNV